MIVIDNEFYKGYEGEPEINLIIRKEEEEKIICMWAEYFNHIVEHISPEEGSFTAMVYSAYLDGNWYEDDPFEFENREEIMEQLKKIPLDQLEETERALLQSMIQLFEEAIRMNYPVLISE